MPVFAIPRAAGFTAARIALYRKPLDFDDLSAKKASFSYGFLSTSAFILCNRTAEVRGSIPLSSTSRARSQSGGFARTRLGRLKNQRKSNHAAGGSIAPVAPAN